MDKYDFEARILELEEERRDMIDRYIRLDGANLRLDRRLERIEDEPNHWDMIRLLDSRLKRLEAKNER